MQIETLDNYKNFPKHEFDLLSFCNTRFVEVNLAEGVRDALRLFEFLDDYFCLEEDKIFLIKDVILLNKKGVFLFERDEQTEGFYAMQMLNSFGLKALLDGDYDGSCPRDCYLADDDDEPAGIYVWGFIAPGFVADGIRYVSQFLQEPQFKKANIYARPVTKEGHKITLDFGFEKINSLEGDLYCYTRLVNRYYC